MKVNKENSKKLYKFLVKISEELRKDCNKYPIRTIAHNEVYELPGIIKYTIGNSKVRATESIRLDYNLTSDKPFDISITTGKLKLDCPDIIAQVFFEIVEDCAKKQMKAEHDRVEKFYNDAIKKFFDNELL